MRKQTYVILSIVPLSLFVLFFTSQFVDIVNADTITDQNYSIDVQDIESDPQPTTKPILTKTPEIKKDFTTGQNYTVNASNDAIAISLSQRSVDLGILTATNPVIRTSDITIANPPTGAQVLTYENHPLLSYDNATIQDSSCDNGVCTQTIAAPWQSTLTYGFGYRCESLEKNVCDSQFSGADTFKQFADDGKSESPQVLMVNAPNKSETMAKVIYKVNISGTQKAGGYNNSIIYLAFPNF